MYLLKNLMDQSSPTALFIAEPHTNSEFRGQYTEDSRGQYTELRTKVAGTGDENTIIDPSVPIVTRTLASRPPAHPFAEFNASKSPRKRFFIKNHSHPRVKLIPSAPGPLKPNPDK